MEEKNTILETENKKNLTPKKKAQIISLILVVTVLVLFIIVVTLYFYVINYPTATLTYKSNLDLRKEYSLSEDGMFADNIVYEDYLQPISVNVFDSEYYRDKYMMSEYGASSDKSAKENSQILDDIISQIEGHSGVIFVDGNYKINPTKIISKVTIMINEDCSLIGPTYEEYQASDVSYNLNGSSMYKSSPIGLLYAYNEKDIKIYGQGKIICNGTTYFNDSQNSEKSSPLETFSIAERVKTKNEKIMQKKETREDKMYSALAFYDCSNVSVENAHIIDAISCACNFVDCDKVEMKNCVIENNLYAQDTDGIVLNGCQNSKITHCFVSTAHDGLCVKSNKFEKSDSIVFNRCSVISMNVCFRIGDQTSQPIKDISCINSCFLSLNGVNSAMCGVEIDSVDSSDINGITVDNIFMRGVSSVALIWLGARLAYGSQVVGSIENIKITNIEAKEIEMASAISGIRYEEKNYNVKKITFANWKVSYRNCKENLDVGNVDMMDYMDKAPSIDKIVCKVDENNQESIKDMPVYGIFARYVDNIRLINVKIEQRSNKLVRDNIVEIDVRYHISDVSAK